MDQLFKDGAQYLLDHWVLTTVLAVVSFVYLHYITAYGKLRKLGFKGPTPWPVIGTSFDLIRGKDMHLVLDENVKKYGKLFGMYFFRSPSVVVADIEMLKTILVKDFEKFHDRPIFADFPQPMASMLTSITGQKWKNVRSILTPTFTSGKLKQMMFIMQEASDTLVEKLEQAAIKSEAVDIHGWLQRITLEVIISSSFGIKTESQTNPDDKLVEMAKKAMDPGILPIAIAMVPFIGKYLSRLISSSRFGVGMAPLAKVSRNIIKTRQESSKNGEQRKDLLSLMLNSQSPENKGYHLTDDEVIAQMILFMLAGYDTSSNTLALTCYNFVVFPEVQEKVYQEILSVCGAGDETVTYDHVQKMPYLEACISETLRLYPPGFALNRIVTQSCTLNGVKFEKGMSVIVPVYSLHHDKQYWPDPELYKPERFLPENKDSIPPFAYLPFGDGPRNCVGMRFAWMEVKVVLVRMLQKCRLVRRPETNVPIKMCVKTVLTPANPVFVGVEKR
eukprot:gene5402-6078_t